MPVAKDHHAHTRPNARNLPRWIGWPLRSKNIQRSRLTGPAPPPNPTLTGADATNIQPYHWLGRHEGTDAFLDRVAIASQAHL